MRHYDDEAHPPFELPVSFYYEGNPVGAFEDGVMPTVPGTYRYMPFRGVGNFWMGQALGEGRTVFCTYPQGASTIRFQLIARHADRTLVLDNFSAVDGE
ncbi:hypothetical protein GAO09_15880 [Rhizobiales bacterium RZME27]|jgi:hypothetical protein|uniref:Uncharacterized protein n=1 Tax=Endobacterium cereale TaxID=2663029 RepID=A0A6A8A9Z7_9HYPH|nr:hypothetical protein [Endobacterium cereale]MEB2847069.1 hypothetical protein [Endobacterium cereale]MQY47514.1 hypothetical protein [Endobacterium cereale]